MSLEIQMYVPLDWFWLLFTWYPLLSERVIDCQLQAAWKYLFEEFVFGCDDYLLKFDQAKSTMPGKKNMSDIHISEFYPIQKFGSSLRLHFWPDAAINSRSSLDVDWRAEDECSCCWISSRKWMVGCWFYMTRSKFHYCRF